MEYFLSERFIFTALLYIDIFYILDPLTRILQSINIDLLGAIKSLHIVTDNNKKHLNEWIDRTKEKAKITWKNLIWVLIFTYSSFKKEKKIIEKKLRIILAITDPLYEFKIKTYFVSLDTINTAINDRLTSKSQDLLKDISLFSTND